MLRNGPTLINTTDICHPYALTHFGIVTPYTPDMDYVPLTDILLNNVVYCPLRTIALHPPHSSEKMQ